jgi:thiol-disulfide isomerase/thioredoxin
LFPTAVFWHIRLTSGRIGLFKMFYRAFAIFLFSALLGAAGTGFPSNAYSEGKGFVSVDPALPAPLFPFEDGEGRTFDLKDFRGRYVILNLWETSCAPCVAEMPKLNTLSKTLDHKSFVIIALDEEHDGSNAARIFFKRHDIDQLPIYTDTSGQAPFILRARGLPTTFLIDPHGMEIARLEGPADWTEKTMVSYLQTQPPPQPQP